jgi:hypothetical protein
MRPSPTSPAAVFAALVALPFAAAGAVEGAVPAVPAPEASAPPAGTLEWNLRLRHEAVDDDAFARDARATTLRLRAGWRLRWGRGFEALLEGEGIASAGAAYDSGANGTAARPAIADPEGAELNQALVGWNGARAAATLGRQRLLFANQRWVGNSGWRQNEQTFDAFALEWTPRPGMVLRHAWLDRVHRVAGDRARVPLARERGLDSHVLDLDWQRGRHRLGAFLLAHEDRDVADASTRTFGLRASASTVRDGQGWALALEAARQRDHARNPLDFSHAYWRIEPSLVRRGVSYVAGWEHLGGDGRHALQAPLGTLHAFNGWADKFNATPARGLDDRYIGASGRAGKGDWSLAWHDYRAEDGAHYGREWNAAWGWPLRKDVKLLAKAARYDADHHGRDAAKAWLQLEWTP